jgi:predicted transcriptional regulator
MKVADIMEPAVRTVAVDTPVSEVVVSLADAQVTGLPVLDARNRVVGVVSSTDLIISQAETRSAEERQILLEQTPKLRWLAEYGRGALPGDHLPQPTDRRDAVRR